MKTNTGSKQTAECKFTVNQMFIITEMTTLPYSCVRQPPRTSQTQRRRRPWCKCCFFLFHQRDECTNYEVNVTNCQITGITSYKAGQSWQERFMHHKVRHQTFIHQELPAICQEKLPNFQRHFTRLRNKNQVYRKCRSDGGAFWHASTAIALLMLKMQSGHLN